MTNLVILAEFNLERFDLRQVPNRVVKFVSYNVRNMKKASPMRDFA